MKNYDLAIIGSGPGGYVAALYAARHKMTVCVIEKELVGGTCLNRGCIPTKSLLHAASIVSTIQSAPLSGITIDGCHIDFERMVARKNEVVTRLRNGIETLFRASKVDLVRGTASIVGAGSVSINGADTIAAKHIIIAAGSVVRELPGITGDADSILSSDSILDLTHIPRSLCIIGGGAIGCEFATLFNALGSAVTIVELTDRLVPAQSREISRKLEQLYRKRRIECLTSSRVASVTKGEGMTVTLVDGRSILAEKCLISVGRVPNTGGLNLDKAGVKTDNGRIIVDEDLQTTVPGIFAIGDCVIGPQLAHKASYDGIIACDNILGLHRKADYTTVPNCIWTDPQIASVGLSEDDARARLSDVKTAKFPYLASGKAFLSGKSDGFVKIIGDSAGIILGVEICGEGACELIAEAVLAKTANLTIKEWAQAVHGHPTLSEMLQEAAYLFLGSGIHTL